jgi:hypothetical protein
MVVELGLVTWELHEKKKRKCMSVLGLKYKKRLKMTK